MLTPVAYKPVVKTILLLLLFCNANATNYIVSTKTDLINKMVAAMPGDTVIVANGTYNYDLISFVNSHGVVGGAPIVLRAQTPGMVIFNGTTKMSFQITNMVLTGFTFKNGSAGASSVIKVGKGSNLGSFYCRITNNLIDNYNSDTALLQKNAWIELDGDHHRVDHNTFVNKSNGTATIINIYQPVVYPAKAPSTFNRIDSNYFKQRSYQGSNEGETIRIGDANSTHSDGFNVIEYNLIEDVTTEFELEVLSNKSHSNTYRYNTIRNSFGGICLRSGRYCQVYGNFIINDDPLVKAAGIRIIDKGHRVYNNYVEGVNGAGLSSDQKRASICLYNGSFTDTTLGSGDYFAADSCIVAFNTVVNATSGAGIALGCIHGGNIQPKGMVLANNIVKMASGNAIYQNSVNTLLTQSSEGNIYEAAAIGIATTGWQSNTLNFATRTNGVLIPPSLVQDAAINSTAYASLLANADGQGQTRTGTFDVGFDELNGTGPIIIKPLLPQEVGANFYGALPVHLLQFSLQKNNSGIQLYWDVADEISMKQYEVEHSENGIHFNQIGIVTAGKNAKASYTFLHNYKITNRAFYRLKLVNADGSFVYGPVRNITNKDEVSFKLYPNPAQAFLTIEVNNAQAATIKIINSLGQIVKQINVANVAATNKVNIAINDLQNGLYYTEYFTQNKTVTYPFIISNNK